MLFIFSILNELSPWKPAKTANVQNVGIVEELFPNLVQIAAVVIKMPFNHSSRKHTYIILTLLNPTLYCKTGVYRGIHYSSNFAKNI